MKKLTGILLLTAAIIACKQPVDYKKVRDEVMQFHDVVMADQHIVLSNQLKLDTLLKDLKGLKAKFPEVDTLIEKEDIKALIADLTKADDQMNNWMQQFEPDVTGKSNEVAVQYFRDEMVKIVAVDSLYKKEIRASGAYLRKFGK
jgi:hypothetical protein